MPTAVAMPALVVTEGSGVKARRGRAAAVAAATAKVPAATAAKLPAAAAKVPAAAAVEATAHKISNKSKLCVGHIYGEDVGMRRKASNRKKKDRENEG